MSFFQRLLHRVCLNKPARVIEIGGAPYLYRIYLGRCLGLTFYLHRFVSPDAERWVHDHPFDALAVVLSGGYWEERLVALSWPHMELEARPVSWWSWISGDCFHRILAVEPNTWTLFVTGRKRKGWGFLEGEGSQIVYRNPFGNVGDKPWWIGAHSYGFLLAAWEEHMRKTREALDSVLPERVPEYEA